MFSWGQQIDYLTRSTTLVTFLKGNLGRTLFYIFILLCFLIAEKGNLSGSETEKRLSSLSRNSSGSISDFGDAGITAFPNENFSQSTLVPLEGCSNSEALQFMNERMHLDIYIYFFKNQNI